MILERVMESLFAVADIFFVSRISVHAVPTVGLTESILTLVYSTAIGMSMATTAMVARRIGEKKPGKAADAAFQSILLATALSLVISIAGAWFATDILALMGGSKTLIESGAGYTRIMFGGNITIMLLFLLNAVFRGAGDASIAMRTLWLANGLNIILDPCLIFGWGPFPEMGVTGAAVATNLGRGVGILYQLYHLFSGQSLVKMGLKSFTIIPGILRKLVNVSAGGAGQFLIGSASWVFLVRIISMFGSDAVAGYTIAFRIIIFTILPSWGMANAAATLVGQSLGAQDPDRAERSVWKCGFYNMVFLGVIALVFGLAAEWMVSIFTQIPEVIRYGALGLRIICFGYVFFAYGMVVIQAFNGAGDTRTPTIINFFCYWLFQIPLAYLVGVSFGFGPTGVYLAIAIAESLIAVIGIWVFRQGKWKMTRI